MPAYVITEMNINDHLEIAEYQKLTPATIAAFDGKFIARGGKTTVLEGDWDPERVVILEFPTAERASEWWHSEVYSSIKTIRQRAATTKMLIVQGV